MPKRLLQTMRDVVWQDGGLASALWGGDENRDGLQGLGWEEGAAVVCESAP